MYKKLRYWKLFNMQKIYNIFYYILIFCTTQILSNIWLSYFIKNNILLKTISVILSFVTIFSIFKKNSKLKKLNNETDFKNKKLNYFKNFIMTTNKKESINLIKNLINPNLQKFKNSYLIDKKLNNMYIFNFHKETLMLEDYFDILQTHKGNYSKIYVCCIAISQDISNANTNNEIEFLTIDKLFEYLPEDFFDTIHLNLNIKKQKNFSLKKLLNISTQPHKWKSYFFYGLMLLILNRFNKSKIYFSIFATIFFTLCIICLFKKIINYAPNNDNL